LSVVVPCQIGQQSCSLTLAFEQLHAAHPITTSQALLRDVQLLSMALVRHADTWSHAILSLDAWRLLARSYAAPSRQHPPGSAAIIAASTGGANKPDASAFYGGTGIRKGDWSSLLRGGGGNGIASRGGAGAPAAGPAACAHTACAALDDACPRDAFTPDDRVAVLELSSYVVGLQEAAAQASGHTFQQCDQMSTEAPAVCTQSCTGGAWTINQSCARTLKV
jgi:hypothetical protein